MKTLIFALIATVVLCGLEQIEPGNFVEEIPLWDLPNQEEASITVKVGQKFVISLQTIPTTGYEWHLQDYEQLGKMQFLGGNKTGVYDLPNRHLAGASGKQVFTFTAKAKGTERLVFWCIRSWIGTPDIVYTVTVSID